MSTKNPKDKPDASAKQTEQKIHYTLLEIIELFPQYTIAQHLTGILRRKSTITKEPYYWSNDTLLKRMESYKHELETDFLDEEED